MTWQEVVVYVSLTWATVTIISILVANRRSHRDTRLLLIEADIACLKVGKQDKSDPAQHRTDKAFPNG